MQKFKFYFFLISLTQLSGHQEEVTTCCPTSCHVVNLFEKEEVKINQLISEVETNVTLICDLIDELMRNSRARVMSFEEKIREMTNKKDAILSEFINLGNEKRTLNRTLAQNQIMYDNLRLSRVYNKNRFKNLRQNCTDAPKQQAQPCPYNITGYDCADIYFNGGNKSGVYFININGTHKLVYCDQETDGGGWTFIHQHHDNEVEFNKNWTEYKNGFGQVDCDHRHSNFWLGNEAIHVLTSNSHYHMRVDVEDWENNERYAMYTHFRVGSSATFYTLTLSGYLSDPSGDIGDGFSGYNFGNPGDIMITKHKGMSFSTLDHDNDNYIGNCASHGGGGWWYNICSAINLNGVIYKGGYYALADTPLGIDNGMIWGPWKGLWYSLKKSSMKIRPAFFLEEKGRYFN